MTPRRLTFQLTPLLDLLLIVLFAQFLEVRNTTVDQERTTSAQVENLELTGEQTSAALATLQSEHDRLLKKLLAKDDELSQLNLARQDLAARGFELEQEVDRISAEREAIASLYPKLFDLPDEVVKQLFAKGDRPLTEDEIERLREQFKLFATMRPGESARHILTVDEMWKRCDVWSLYIKSSGLTVVTAGDRSSQFEATTAKEFEKELYEFYRTVPPQKSLVILLLSYGNIDANVYEAAIEGLPKAAERMRSAAGGRSRFESAVLGFDPMPPEKYGPR